MTLGASLQVVALALRGVLDEEEWRRLLLDITRALGMCAAWEPVSYGYPVEGKGGVGFTLIQPITESFLAVDAWPDHGGAYLVVASCKPFDRAALLRAIREAGLILADETVTGTLALKADA